MDLEQLALVGQIVAARAPELLPLVGKLARGESITQAEASVLRNAILGEMLEREMEDGRLTARGEALDRIVGELGRSVATG